MKIIVNGRTVIPKQGFSFDYTVENRLFSGRDGYTMAITFPLAGCVENLTVFGHINRVDAARTRIHLPCQIIDGPIALAGTLTAVKISSAEVECQFTEGRCSQTIADPFTEQYICDLDLGSPAATLAANIPPLQAWRPESKAEAVALPFINESYPDAPNNWAIWNVGPRTYTWAAEVTNLAWQPYLIRVAEKICAAIGYEAHFAEWRASHWRHLLCCNCLPASWETPDYAAALPKWTVLEFFEKLEHLLRGEFDIDHTAKTVKFAFTAPRLAAIPEVKLDDVVDNYTSSISDTDATCSYLPSKGFRYDDPGYTIWKYRSCRWLAGTRPKVKAYNTLSELIDRNQKRETPDERDELYTVEWGEPLGDDTDSTTIDALLHVNNSLEDTSYIMRCIGENGHNDNSYAMPWPEYVLEPINIFGLREDVADIDNRETIQFVPVCITDTHVSGVSDRGYMMYLTPSATSSTADRTDTGKTRMMQLIEAGEPTGNKNYYDKIFVAFWDGTHPDPYPHHVYPVIDPLLPTQRWEKPNTDPRFSLRIPPEWAGVPMIDAASKYTFTWLSATIPSPRAVFNIKGRRFVCEKITATFTEHGHTGLLKGDFYPLTDIPR